MNTTTIAHDQGVRCQAINHQQSFIIQAPAGSGKTELLAQRYLNLLANAVKSPEEIIAITFTRKAAAEMRERIICALELANSQPEPTEPHKKLTWQLARNVLAIDNKQQWQLLANPNRLRIMTIDALSAMLSGQLPLLAGFGAKPEIADNARPLYRQTVEAILENPQQLQPAIETLLLHLDNHAERLAELLLQLLMKREQWLPHIFRYYQDHTALKALLEQSLANIVTSTLTQATHAIPHILQAELIQAARFAANQLVQDNPNHPLCICWDLTTLPNTTPEALPQWRAIANLLLSQQLEWRKMVDKRIGFPPQHKAAKQQMLTLIKAFSDNQPLQQCLINIIHCPPSHYTTQQWQVIQALLELLPQLTALLHVQFQQHGVIDFIELTLGALRALGHENEPTDLALYLDYQIQHLLIDEFQDTSVMQFNLLQRLVQEWHPHDGKTLFLVGDPMQSIYRFRNAEVSLFLTAQQQGVGPVKLIPLTLTQNFRSTQTITTWINKLFQQVFPQTADSVSGAVPYHHSYAVKPAHINSQVTYHLTATGDHTTLPKALTALIQQYQQQNPTTSIAILVRSRSHLKAIIPILAEHNIAFQAVELETLYHRAEINDLVALTKALLNITDRIAWLSVLRAPWCGLTLNDLHVLCQHAKQLPLWCILLRYQTISSLSTDAKLRLSWIIPQLAHSLATQGRLTLAQWVKGTWLGISGKACLNTSTALNNVNRYFQLLEEIQYEFSLDLLQQKLEKLYAKPDNQTDSNLQLMTIHKSKGLEFDHVIIPELQSSTPADPNSLLMWLEQPNSHGDTDLIFAPIKANDEDSDAIHYYLRELENRKLKLEMARLFYVATTRAKQSLHLFCQLPLDESTQQFKTPNKNSLLALLWPTHQTDFMQDYQTHLLTAVDPTPTDQQTYIQRLPSNWQPHITSTMPPSAPYIIHEPFAENLYMQFTRMSLGTVVHEALQQLAEDHTFSIEKQRPQWLRRLLQLGVDPTTASQQVTEVEFALQQTLSDPRGQWILQPHRAARNEYAITTHTTNGWQNYIIDRTFIDETDTRWIIDYKTTQPNNEPLTDFLQQQKILHQPQLQQYATTITTIELRPIMLGLYFPLCQGWISMCYSSKPEIFSNSTIAGHS